MTDGKIQQTAVRNITTTSKEEAEKQLQSQQTTVLTLDDDFECGYKRVRKVYEYTKIFSHYPVSS